MRRALRSGQAAALVTVAGGLLVLAGWASGWVQLTDRLAGWSMTKPLTALILVMCGVSVWRPTAAPPASPAVAQHRLGTALVVAAWLLAAARLVDLGTGWPIGLDDRVARIFVPGSGRGTGAWAMSGAAAIGLWLTASGLLALQRRRSQVLAQTLLVLGGAVFILPLLDDLLAVGLGRPRSLLPAYEHLALPTAVLGLACVAGALQASAALGFLRVAQGAGPGGRSVRRLFPQVTAALLLVTWLGLVGEKLGFYTPDVGVTLILVATMLVIGLVLWSNARALDAAAAASERFFARGLDMFCVANLTGYFERINPTLIDVLGWTEEELRRRPFLDFVHPDDRAATMAEMATLGEGAATLNFTNRYRRVDGSWRWLAWRAVPDVREGLIYATARDVTDVHEATQALRRSEQDLSVTLESIGDGVIATDNVGRVTRMNPIAEALTGWTAGEARGRPVAEVLRLIDDRTGGAGYLPVDDVLRSGETRTLSEQVSLLARDGTRHPVADSAAPIRQPDGSIRGVVMVFRDVTADREAALALERFNEELERRVEERSAELAASRLALERSEEQYRLIVETASEVFYRVDTAAGALPLVNFISQRVSNLTGRTPEAFRDDPDLWRRLVHPDDAAPWAAAVNGLRADDAAKLRTYRIMHVDGRYRWVEDEFRPWLDRRGELAGYQGIVRDVTDRRQLEAQLLQSQKLESVGRLAGGVAHDFNNLLTVIQGVAGLHLAALSESSPERGDWVEVQDAAMRAASLTRQLLAFSRRQVTQPRVFDLMELVDRMQTMLRRLIGEDVEVVFLPAPEPGRVRADPGHVEQVLANLVVNARDAMPDGGRLSITVRNVVLDDGHPGVPIARPGPYVLLTVSDTGIGMDAATRARIFEPFFTTKEPGKGTGLGLATVYGIVEQSGGSIHVDSEPGRGSAFRIWLPRIEEATSQAEAAIAVPAGGRETILVVEDDKAVRKLVQRLLESMGYTVIAASSGREALHSLDEAGGRVSLVMTDVVMPGMNGPELADRIAARHRGVRILYTSGYTDKALLQGHVLRGDAPLLVKPYTQEDLQRSVRRVLDA